MKKTLYPKTQRIKNENTIVTEKLDGSNLGIFKIGGELLIAQRNHIFKISELTKENSYKGLIWWLEQFAETLDFCEGSGVFGEWIGMGKIGYGDSLNKRFYIFAKANIDEEYNIRNLNYTLDLLIYPFEKQVLPECISLVPKIEYKDDIGIDALNGLYEKYLEEIERPVEGFIINNSNQITKYVRQKNGKLTEQHSY